MNQGNYDFLFKYIVVGDSNVGKSCIILRYTQLLFKRVEFASKIVESEGMTVKTQIWDTAGQESFKAITRSYYKGSIAAFLIFDITSKTSFDSLNKWLYEIKNHSHQKVEIVLLGNKVDIKSRRQVTFQEAQTFARNNGFDYYQVSALTGQKIADVFDKMTKQILNKVLNKQLNTQGQTSLGVRKGKKQKKQIITRVSSGFNDQLSLQKKTSCCK